MTTIISKAKSPTNENPSSLLVPAKVPRQALIGQDCFTLGVGSVPPNPHRLRVFLYNLFFGSESMWKLSCQKKFKLLFHHCQRQD